MTAEAIDALRRAVAAAPDDVELRLHLAELVAAHGDPGEAIALVSTVLQQDPGHDRARTLMGRLLAPPATTAPSATPTPSTTTPDPEPSPEAETGAGTAAETDEAAPPAKAGFDWHAAEAEVRGLVEPMFVDGDRDASDLYEVVTPGLRLTDVGGMAEVKQRLEASFLAPLRNPELRRLYAKSLRGGLLLYGPPGCGKTFLARALAGELGAGFLTVAVTDVLDPYIGVSERNLHEAFQTARRAAPCVLFLDELDGLGQRRGQAGNASVRNTVNQLLVELDGIGDANDGVFVLGATNQPWDVDPALRRPGRLDRTVLVLPPDRAAREAIFRYHLAQRPVAGIDVGELARRSDGLSGADIAMVCEEASELALLDSVRTGDARLIAQQDLLTAVGAARPSIGPWLDSARNVAMFGDDDGTYAELRKYLKKVRRS